MLSLTRLNNSGIHTLKIIAGMWWCIFGVALLAITSSGSLNEHIVQCLFVIFNPGPTKLKFTLTLSKIHT